MANYFPDVVFAELASQNITAYNFIDIYLDGEVAESPGVFPNIHLTDFSDEYTMLDAKDITVTYEPELVKAVERPPLTGNITQEIQRLAISQALGRVEEPAEFITRLGNKFHAALIVIRTFTVGSVMLPTPIPINASEGIIKSVSRKLQSSDVIIEFSNSYGKLDMLKEMRSTQGSIQRFIKDDTAFDKASLDISVNVLEWGT